MSRAPSPAFVGWTKFAEPGSLLVEDQRFALVADWVIGAELSDAAFRVYSSLLRFCNGSGRRMPSRRLFAERLHRSVDSIDREMRALEAQRSVRVDHRRRGREHPTNRYHLRTAEPSTSQPRRSNSGRRSAAQPTDCYRHFCSPNPSTPAPSMVDADRRLLTGCGITDLHRLAQRCDDARRSLGQPATRWAAPCLLVAIQLVVNVRHWPRELVETALPAVAADPRSRSPMRPAEAGPWWDLQPATNPSADDPTLLVALEQPLDAVAGRRPALQARAGAELEAERLPMTRTTVVALAVEIPGQECDSCAHDQPALRACRAWLIASMTDNRRRGVDRQHTRPGRRRTLLLRLADAEYDDLVAAAAIAGLTPSGFAAESVVAVTQRTALPALDPARVLLQELMHLRIQLRRYGRDINQALRDLIALGVAPASLTETVHLSNNAVTRIDDAMDQLCRLLRKSETLLPNR